jgi:hypothetical protein
MKKSLFFSLIGFLVILTVTIVIILYAEGYTYNFSSNSIVKTGTIKISTTPSGEVYMNNIDEGKSPVSIFNLKPSNYLVSVKDNGYVTWSSRIPVKGGKISLVYPILYPSSVKATRIESQANVANVFFGNSTYAYTSIDKTTGNTSLYVHSFGSSFLGLGSNTQLVLNLSSLKLDPSYSLVNVLFSPNGGNLLLSFTSKTLPNKYIITSTDGATPPVDLDTIINSSLYSTVIWGNDDEHILLSNSSILVSVNTTTNQKILLVQTDANTQIENSDLDGSVLYYVEKITDAKNKTEYTLNSIAIDGTAPNIISTSNTPINDILSSGDNYAYETDGGGLSIFYPSLSNNNIIIPSKSNLYPIAFSPDGKYLLYKDSNNELYSYSIETAQTYNLNLNLNMISTIVWDKSSTVLLFTMKGNVVNGTTYYNINAINYDGSNNDQLFNGLIVSPDILVSPNTSDLVFEMANISQNPTAVDQGIYTISISGL